MSENGIELILNELKAVNERMTAIETNMARKEDVATKEDIASVNQKVDGVSKQVAGNAESLTAIHDKLRKVDNATDILSRRSIEQEAELKRIK